MIKLERPTEPQILFENQVAWTEYLCSLVDLHGGYNKTPKDEKDSALQFYRHDHIRKALRASSFRKCAFCECIPEETGYPEVEHFHPKSRCPDQAFKWASLLYGCKTCNVNKLIHDTVSAPIINPYDIDPQEPIEYDGIILRLPVGLTQTSQKRPSAYVAWMMPGCSVPGQQYWSVSASLRNKYAKHSTIFEGH